jgi:signal transduction histidine kinase
MIHAMYSPEWNGGSIFRRYWPYILLGITSVVGFIWYGITNSTAVLLATLFVCSSAFNSIGFAVARLRGMQRTASVFNWLNGIGAAVGFGILSPDFLPISMLCMLDGALSTLSLDGSSRRELRAYSIVSVIVFIGLLCLTESMRADLLPIAPPLHPLEKAVLFIGFTLGYGLTCLRGMRAFFDAIRNTLDDLRRTHDKMDATRYETNLRLQEMEQLLDISRVVGSTQNFQMLLANLLTQLHTIVGYYRANVMLLRDGKLQVIAGHGAPAPSLPLMESTINRPDNLEFALQLQALHIIHDLSRDYPQLRGSFMGIPLIVRGKFIGMLTLRHEQVNFYNERAADIAMAFANQVAGIIDSAQLQEAATSARVVAERHRLARELHDSVSQSLFGIVLGTRTAREQINRSPEAAHQAISYSLSLANTALNEMRTLIFALRPETLERKGLIAALQVQIDLLQPHHDMSIEFEAPQGEPEAAIHIKEALYRISTEAIQNAIRHSGCHRLQIRLAHDDAAIRVEVIDDGRGFYPDKEYDNHLGLKTMQERATALGGVSSIRSSPGAGTHVTTEVPKD